MPLMVFIPALRLLDQNLWARILINITGKPEYVVSSCYLQYCNDDAIELQDLTDPEVQCNFFYFCVVPVLIISVMFLDQPVVNSVLPSLPYCCLPSQAFCLSGYCSLVTLQYQ